MTSSEKLPLGSSTIRLDFEYDGGEIGKGGNASLFINDKKVAEGRVEKTGVARFSVDETFDLGMDTGSPVSADLPLTKHFQRKLKSVKIELKASQLSAEEERHVRVLNQKAVLAAH